MILSFSISLANTTRPTLFILNVEVPLSGKDQSLEMAS
jgi:hypothetical protein